jgi:GTPase SAR1 family protein
MNTIKEFRIPIGSKLVMIGKSGSGKTFFCKQLIDHHMDLFEDPPHRIIMVYQYKQPWFSEPRYKNIEFYEKVIPDNISASNVGSTVLFLDDIEEDDFQIVHSWFLRNCRPLKTTIIVNYQSLFVNSSHWRSITSNLDFLILFYSIKASYQVKLFARQVFGDNEKAAAVSDLYQRCISEPFGYLLIDLRQGIRYRLRSHLIPNGETTARVYEFRHRDS